MSLKNPIFIEYYPHTSCDCYKVLNPFTGYAEHKLVLCTVEEGIEKATELCKKHLNDYLQQALQLDIS